MGDHHHVVEWHDIPNVADQQAALGKDVAHPAGIDEGEIRASLIAHGLLDNGFELALVEGVAGGGQRRIDADRHFVLPAFHHRGDVRCRLYFRGIDGNALPGERRRGLGGGIHLEIEPSQFFAVALHAHHHAALAGDFPIDARVDVAGNDDRDLGDIFQELQFLFGGEMPEQDDDIGFILQLRGVAAHGGYNRHGMPLLHELGRGESAHAVGERPEHRHAQLVDGEDDVGLGGE